MRQAVVNFSSKEAALSPISTFWRVKVSTLGVRIAQVTQIALPFVSAKRVATSPNWSINDWPVSCPFYQCAPPFTVHDSRCAIPFLRAKEIYRSLAGYVRRNTGSGLEGLSQSSPNLAQPLL